MPDHVRELSHSIVVAFIVAIALILFLIGNLQNWPLEVAAEVASAFAITTSIIFLVMEKIFQRPHFSVLPDRRIVSFGNDKFLAILVQNNGTIDANLVKSRCIITKKILSKEQKYNPSLFLRPVLRLKEEAGFAVPIRMGEEFEVFIPISDMKTNGSEVIKGWISLSVISSFARQYFLFTYQLQDDKLRVRKINSVLSFFAETPVLARHNRRKRDDSVLEI